MRHAALVSETVTVHAWYDRSSDLFLGQITDDTVAVIEDTGDNSVTSYDHPVTHDEVIRSFTSADGFTDTVNLIEAIREELTALDLKFPANAAQEMSELLDDDAMSAVPVESAQRARLVAASF
ncbi:hypothetical protein [Streptomyces mirabilis]|uniref:hypothetical protein n=1 Tax=Streptomyces mirabilis TaxID=68239 RepID=UPI0033D3BE6C